MTEMISWLFVMYFAQKLMNDDVRLPDPSLCPKQLALRELNEK